jgi:hypothetical protein
MQQDEQLACQKRRRLRKCRACYQFFNGKVLQSYGDVPEYFRERYDSVNCAIDMPGRN